MRRIEKGPEPVCLEAVRQTPGVNWNSASGKQEMRKHLWTEQKGLCAYCMSKLLKLPKPSGDERKPDDYKMKIEHFVSQATTKDNKDLLFTWTNLLGVCPGDIGIEGEGGELEGRFHCDTRRAQFPVDQQTLHVHPAMFPPDAGKLFSFTREGVLLPANHLDSETKARLNDTIKKLNLNIARLRRNRKAVLDALKKRLHQNDAPRQIKAMLEAAKRIDGTGYLMEYAEVAVQYLEKTLRRHGQA